MKNLLSSIALCASGLITITLATSATGSPSKADSSDPFTIAVYGDAPYGAKSIPDVPGGPNPQDPSQILATPSFIDAINADPKVRLVLHTGDIHSGSNYCTLAYNQTVFNLWKRFKDPLVYTPGDNEWADCHKTKQGGNKQDPSGNYVDYANGDPLANLTLVRSIFFPNPGQTLGQKRQRVISQAQSYDPVHPQDAEYVENVRWEQSGIMFVTLNIPGGSNNDSDIWYGASVKAGSQEQDSAQRTAADLRWLGTAFENAKANGDKAVVIIVQADMWDLDGTLPEALHIANYQVFIDKIAEKTVEFGKPVLLINGDSHAFRSDNPLHQSSSTNPCVIEAGATVVACNDDAWLNQPQGVNFPHYDVTNFHRLVVHGNTFPLEYLRLTVDPHANYSPSENTFGPFSWERVNP